MASSIIKIVLKTLNGEMLEVEVDPYDKNIKPFLRNIVKENLFPSAMLSDIKFIRIKNEENDEKNEDENKVGDLKNPPLKNGEMVMVMNSNLITELFNKLITLENNDEIDEEIKDKISILPKHDKDGLIDNLSRMIIKLISNSKDYHEQYYDVLYLLQREKYDRMHYPALFNLIEAVIFLSEDIIEKKPEEMIDAFKNTISKVMTKANRIARGEKLLFTREDIEKDVATILLQLMTASNRNRYFKKDMIDFFEFLIKDVGADPYAPFLGSILHSVDNTNCFADMVYHLLKSGKASEEEMETLNFIFYMINYDPSLSSYSSYSFGSRKNKNKNKNVKSSRKNVRKNGRKTSRKNGRKTSRKNVRKSLRKSSR